MNTAELLSIADTIERNGGWHIAAVKIRGAVEDHLALAAELDNKQRESEAASLHLSTRIRALEAAAREACSDMGCYCEGDEDRPRPKCSMCKLGELVASTPERSGDGNG